MHIRVLFFAAARDVAGHAELPLRVPDGCTVEALWKQLCSELPRLSRLDGIVKTAVNEVYVSGEAPLSEGDVVAIIPPVSGGAA